MSPRDAAADWARQAHAPRDAARERTDDLNVFARNVDGAAEPAAPLNRGRSSGGGEPASVVILPGHHLALEASAGHALDGTAIEFDTVVRDNDWGATLGTGKSTFTFPSTACFDFGDLEVEFDGAAEWAGTVTITVKVNGEARWSASGYANDNGISWSSGMLGAVVEGDTWSLHVDAPGAPAPSVVRVKMQRVERQAPEVATGPPTAPTSADVNIVGSTGHASSNTRTRSVPADTAAGDLLLVVASVTSYEGDAGLPNISDITSAIAWTEIDRNVVNDGSPDRSKTSVWLRFAEAGDAGTSVSVDFTSGSAFAQSNTLSVWRLPQGELGSKSGQTSAVVAGSGTADATPAGVDEASVLDVIVFAGANFGSTTGRPSFSEPSGLTFQSTAFHGSSADKHTHGVAVAETQGSEQTWTVTSNDTTYGWFWRLRVKG